MLHGTAVEGPFGAFGVVASERGVRAVAPLAQLPRDTGVRWHAKGASVPASLAVAAHWLSRYFAGEQRASWEGALDVPGTPLQLAVWGALRALPFGATTTYGALALQLGQPQPGQLQPGRVQGARAVGAAVARNPVALLVPCHRVLGQGGNLGVFAWGAPLKRALLLHEGHPPPPPPAQRHLFAGLPLLAVSG
jgi:O-6-methylguanine DNA methyltransferase